MNAKSLRVIMMLSGIGLAVLVTAISSLKDCQTAVYPMATALFFWALRGPGHVNTTD